MYGDTGGADFVFNQRFGLLDHDQFFRLRRKSFYQVKRKRAGEAKFQYRRIGVSFTHMHVRGAGGNEADALIVAVFDFIEYAGFSGFAQCFIAGKQFRHVTFGVARHHDPARRVFGETFGNAANVALADGDDAFDVADARSHTQDHRRRKLFGQCKGRFGHFVGFLRIGRLENRQVRKASPKAGILFVLRRGETDIVGDGDDQSADNAGQR